jgi:hypothetical protein
VEGGTGGGCSTRRYEVTRVHESKRAAHACTRSICNADKNSKLRKVWECGREKPRGHQSTRGCATLLSGQPGQPGQVQRTPRARTTYNRCNRLADNVHARAKKRQTYLINLHPFLICFSIPLLSTPFHCILLFLSIRSIIHPHRFITRIPSPPSSFLLWLGDTSPHFAHPHPHPPRPHLGPTATTHLSDGPRADPRRPHCRPRESLLQASSPSLCKHS